jgi:hypothetical protein
MYDTMTQPILVYSIVLFSSKCTKSLTLAHVLQLIHYIENCSTESISVKIECIGYEVYSAYHDKFTTVTNVSAHVYVQCESRK